MFAIGTSKDCEEGLCCMWKNTIFRNPLYGEFILTHDYALLSTAEWVTLVPRSNVVIHTAASSSTVKKPLCVVKIGNVYGLSGFCSQLDTVVLLSVGNCSFALSWTL
jgi:hypothetical protein